MKRARLLGVALVGVLVVSSCGSSDPAPAATASTTVAVAGAPSPQLPVTVESADGRQVTVADVERILPLRGNISELVFALGLGDAVVGRDVSATFPEAEGLPIVTRAHDVTPESVISLRPTVVLADTDTGPPEAISQIRNVGIPVVVFDQPTSVGDIGPRVERIAAALGVADAGVALARHTASAIGSVIADAADGGPRPSVAFLYMRGQAAVYLLGGPGSGADSMIEAAGGIDAGTAMGLRNPFTPLTSEAMVAAAPDVILMTDSGLSSVGGVDGLLGIPGIAQTPAGASRRVATVEDGLLYSFGVNTPAALETLARQIHGDGS